MSRQGFAIGSALGSSLSSKGPDRQKASVKPKGKKPKPKK